MKNISEHITYKEGVYSITALRLGLNNDPTKTHLTNMELLAEKIFEPLRKHVGGPIKINSFYRGPELNKAIGGSSNSQHCKGQAIDIDDVYGYMSNADMYENNLMRRLTGLLYLDAKIVGDIKKKVINNLK